MLESNCPLLFVLLHVWLDCDHVLCYEILRLILCLVQIEDELSVPSSCKVGDEEVYGAFWHDHDMLSIYVLKVGLDGKLGLIKLLLPWHLRVCTFEDGETVCCSGGGQLAGFSNDIKVERI
jgi:hypothetical protein